MKVDDVSKLVGMGIRFRTVTADKRVAIDILDHDRQICLGSVILTPVAAREMAQVLIDYSRSVEHGSTMGAGAIVN